jgi:hypothetical protein
MGSRAEAISIIRSTFEDSKEVSEGQFSVTAETDNNRSHEMFLRVLDDLVWVTSPFARVTSITAEEAFDTTDGYIFGIGIHGEHYVFQRVINIEAVDPISLSVVAGETVQAANQIKLSLGLSDSL